MAAGGASLLATVAVFSMLIMSSQGNPRPSCSDDCEQQCHTNCNVLVENSCNDYCRRGGGLREGCRSSVFEQCTTNGDCSGSNGTSTCDCNTVAENTCMTVSDGTLQCDPCKSGIFYQCHSTCKTDCDNKCKKKGCRHV